ncbi:MAG: MetQ/NlpA family ABC transporter substrate-binding protein [Turicibacter sp.]|nr:MetQ/NlpA family ABC transporter substrate-binding protein [Turicibacter sp.]
MKKLSLGVLSLVTAITLVGCGNNESSDKTTLRVGASAVPHAEILEQAKPLLQEQGIELKVTVFQDYVLPNTTLNEGELDANYFQHIPYLEEFNAEHGTNIVNAGGIHIEPIGIYSKNYSSLDELPEGATIILSNSVADHGRMLSLLQTEGLITLDPSVDPIAASVEDIIENPKNLNFKTDIDPGLLVTVYEQNEADAVLINTNYALDGGLNPLTDAIAIEGSESPYANIIAVNSGDENREEIQALIDVLHSKEIQNFILETYEGAVIPVSE